MSSLADRELEDEFDALMRRHRLSVPADRRAAVFAGFVELRRMAALLRQPRAAESEPASVYDVEAVVRGIGRP